MTPIQVPETELLRYFRDRVDHVPQAARVVEAERLRTVPAELGGMFARSLETFSAYRNDQPFYPERHGFGFKPSGVPHGERLDAMVDVAKRLADRGVWDVDGDPRLAFAYLDRELELARCKPRPAYPPEGRLILDLFLVNVLDRTPILSEVKICADEDAFYALIQLLTQSVYALTPSQRARLCLFGSRPDRVIAEAVPGKPARADLYLMLYRPPMRGRHPELRRTAIALSKALERQPAIGRVIRRIRWLELREVGGRLEISVIDAHSDHGGDLRSPNLQKSSRPAQHRARSARRR